MIRIKAINYQTCQAREENLTPETLIQGGGLIGRNSSCDVVLSSPDVSRVHGRIMYQDGDYFFADLGSTGGSLINGEEAPTNQNFPLKPDDLIRIGGFILLVMAVEKDSNGVVSQPQEAAKKNNGGALPLPNAPESGEATVPDLKPIYPASEATVPAVKSRQGDMDDTVLLAPKTSKTPANSSRTVSISLQAQTNNHDVSPGPQTLPQITEALPEQVQELFIKAEDLEAQGNFARDSSELMFRGKWLVEGISLSKHLHQKAIDLCQGELDNGKLCLLVEHSSHFTLWWEKSVGNDSN